LALLVPLSRFTSRVGGGSAFYVRHLRPLDYLPDILCFAFFILAPIVSALTAALLARHQIALVIPERVFIVAVKAAVIAPGLAFSPFAVITTESTGHGAVWFTNARA
jgi:hypothetical protein